MKKGWETKRLGEVCEVIGGGTPAKNNAAFYTGAIPWATVRDMRQDEITETEFRITKEAVRSSATNIVPAGNVVIATRVGLGKICLLGQDTAINQDLRGIIPRDEKSLTSRYLFWWFKSIAKEIVAEGKGATVQGVKLPFVKSLPIPLPPLPEQRRIVGVLDEAFAAIATAKANAEKNLQNAREIFESHLNEVFAKKGEGWVERKLGDICAFRNGINYTKESRGERIKIVGVRNFQQNFSVPLNDLDEVTIDGVLDDLDLLKPGDLLAVRSNGNVALIGRTLFADKIAGRISHSGFTIRIRLSSENVLPKYLCFFMKSPRTRTRLADGGTGTNIKSLNQGMLSALKIPLPPSGVQKAVATQLDALSAETRRLAAIYSRKLAALEELKQALLHRAFSGEL